MAEKEKIAGGYVLEARQLDQSPISNAPPHVREIWAWIRRNANWKDHGKIKRGQILTSYSEIIEGLSWQVGYRKMAYKKHHCETATKALTKAAMITTTKTTRGFIITILNYEKYQNKKNYDNRTESDSESDNDTATTTDTIREEGRKKEYKSLKNMSGAALLKFQIQEVLDHLNKVTGKKFKSHGLIPARLKEGRTVEECKRVIDIKAADPNFSKRFLDHTTLFRPSHFDKYLNQKPDDNAPVKSNFQNENDAFRTQCARALLKEEGYYAGDRSGAEDDGKIKHPIRAIEAQGRPRPDNGGVPQGVEGYGSHIAGPGRRDDDCA